MNQEGDIRLYRERRLRRRRLRLFFIGLLVLAMMFFMIFLISRYYFVVRELSVEGSSRYTDEEVLRAACITVKDSMFSFSEKEVEAKLKEQYPYIASVLLEKDYPDSVKLIVKEEDTTFYFEMMGEYFLFNHELRLMEKFDSHQEMLTVRNPIMVKMPVPKSCIVPQYIQFADGFEYVFALIEELSSSELLACVVEMDLRDKFVIRLQLENDITVEFGDYGEAQEKFLALYRLLTAQNQKMTGTIDFSDYPNCFYALTPVEAD